MRPAARMLLLLGAWLALAVPACLWPGPWRAGWNAMGLGVAVLVLADALLGRRLAPPALERSLPPVLPVGVWTPVKLRLASRSALGQRVRLFDGAPGVLELRHQPRDFTLDAGATLELTYAVCPRRREACRFEPAQLLLAAAGAGRAANSTSCATTGRATACASWTGRPPPGCAG